MAFQAKRNSKQRRSLLANDVEEHEQDFREELRNRRSINRSEDRPIFKNPSKQTSESISAASTDFFHCLKMAADNKINAKNAFKLQMIDYMNQDVFQKDSTLSKNFQLATCSLDAGTKIYAARVDCVAKDITDFSMVMTMSHKNDGGEGGGVEDEDAGTVETKKRKIKKLRRSKIFAKSVKDLQLDFTKLPQTESVYPQVGSLMFEAIDSFNFTERGSNGAIPDLMSSVLEDTEIDKPMKIKIPRTGDLGLCPTLETFVMDFELSKEANNFLNTSTSSMTDTPNLSLKEFNESSLDDNPPPEPINQSFDASVMEEGVDAFGGGGYREADLVADRTPSLLGPMMPKKAVHDGRVIQLQAPAFSKFKKPVNTQSTLCVVKKNRIIRDKPLNFSEKIDLSELITSRKRTTLKRETLEKWSSKKITLRNTICEEEPSTMVLNITRYMLFSSLALPNMDSQELVDDVDKYFPTRNEIDQSQSEDSEEEDEHALVHSDEEGAGDFGHDLHLQDTARASFMSNFGLEEEDLATVPRMVEPVPLEWKPSCKVNIKTLEKHIVSHLQEAQHEELPLPSFHQLYHSLPPAAQQTVTVGTTFFALLNVSNKEGLDLIPTPEGGCIMAELPRRRRKAIRRSLHPAINSDQNED